MCSVVRIFGQSNDPLHIQMFEMRELAGYISPSIRLREEFQVSFLALGQQKSADQLHLVALPSGRLLIAHEICFFSSASRFRASSGFNWSRSAPRSFSSTSRSSAVNSTC